MPGLLMARSHSLDFLQAFSAAILAKQRRIDNNSSRLTLHCGKIATFELARPDSTLMKSPHRTLGAKSTLFKIVMTTRNFNTEKEQDPAKSWTPETAFQARIILIQARRHYLRRQIRGGNSVMFACAELIDTGHLDGWVTLGTDGKPREITDVRITTLGREYLDNFENESASSPSLFQKPILWLAKGFAVAILFAALIALIPDTDMRAGKPKDLATNSFPLLDNRVTHSPVLVEKNKR